MFNIFKSNFADLGLFDQDAKAMLSKLLQDALIGCRVTNASKEEQELISFFTKIEPIIVRISNLYAAMLIGIEGVNPEKVPKKEYIDLIQKSLEFSMALLEKVLGGPCQLSDAVARFSLHHAKLTIEMDELKKDGPADENKIIFMERNAELCFDVYCLLRSEHESAR